MFNLYNRSSPHLPLQHLRPTRRKQSKARAESIFERLRAGKGTEFRQDEQFVVRGAQEQRQVRRSPPQEVGQVGVRDSGPRHAGAPLARLLRHPRRRRGRPRHRLLLPPRALLPRQAQLPRPAAPERAARHVAEVCPDGRLGRRHGGRRAVPRQEAERGSGRDERRPPSRAGGDAAHAGWECAHRSEASCGTWGGRGGDGGLTISVDDYL
ncbi:AP2/ERF domain-containing protein [Psidium guajava]|nr:AP2/ERF domain-containing protein [Psidium guajava]